MPLRKELVLSNFRKGLVTDRPDVSLEEGEFSELDNYYLQAGKMRTRPPIEIFPLRSGSTWGFGNVKGFQMVGDTPVLIRQGALSTFNSTNGQCVDLETAVQAFFPLGQTHRNWTAITASLSDGDIYASVEGGDIYEQDAGAGDFLALSQTSRNWAGMAVAPTDNDVYACVSNRTIQDTSSPSGNSYTAGDTPTGSVPSLTWNPATQTERAAFSYPALAAAVATITSVTTSANVSNAGTAGGNVAYYHICRIGGVNYAGAAKSCPIAGNDTSTQVWATDPSTGIAWTVAGLNAAVFGVQLDFDAAITRWDFTGNARINDYTTPGDVYKQTVGAGAFASLSQTTRDWRGMAADTSGNLYASVNGGDIYKQTAGAGAFTAIGGSSRAWRGMAGAPNGDVYAVVSGGDIYKQTGGGSTFNALSQTSRLWTGVCAAPNGDIYACVDGGDIYKRTAGAGDFMPLGQVSRRWVGLAAPTSDIIYAIEYGGDIYSIEANALSTDEPQSVQYKNFGYAAVGNGVIKFNTETYWALGVAPPAGAPTIADGAAGAVEAGVMYGIYTFVDAEGVESGPSPVSGSLTHTVNTQVDWTGVGVALDTRVVARNLYRTFPGQTGEYFFVGQIENNSATTFTENTTIPEMGDLAEIYKQRYVDLSESGLAIDIATVFERLWVTDGTFAYGSLPEEPEYFDAENVYAFSPDDGEEIKALETLPGMLIVLKQGSVWALDQSLGAFEFLPRLVDNASGCAYTASAASSGRYVFYASKSAVYMCDGRSPGVDISTGRIDLRNELGAGAVGCVFRKRNWYILYSIGEGGSSKIRVFDYVRNYWFTLSYGKTITDGVNTAAAAAPTFFSEGLNSAGSLTVYTVMNATSGDRGTLTDLFDEEAVGGSGAADAGIGDAVNAVAAAAGYSINEPKILQTAQFKALDWGSPGLMHTIDRVMISCTDPVASVTYPDNTAELMDLSVIREDGRVAASSRTGVDISGTRQWKNCNLSSRDRRSTKSAVKIVRNSRWPIDIEGLKIYGELWDSIPAE
jgi:hypothetical protein